MNFAQPRPARQRIELQGIIVIALALALPFALPTGGHAANNTASLSLPAGDPGEIDLALNLSSDITAPSVNDLITFEITVDNPAADDATGVITHFPLPGELSFVGAAANIGAYDHGTGQWNTGTIPAGGQALLTLEASVLATAVGVDINSTAAIVSADQVDPVSGNNTDTVTLRVPLADLAVDVSADDQHPAVGDDVRLTITIQNNGPHDGAAIAALVPLPTGLSLSNYTVSHGTWDSGTGIWSVGGLASAETSELVVDATVTPPGAGLDILVGASITDSSPQDPNPANNTDSVTLDVPGADIQVALTTDIASPHVFESTTLTLTVTNAGPDPTDGVVVSLTWIIHEI